MDVSEVERAFKRKLGADEDRGKHHVFYFFQDGDSSYTVAKLSHSWRGALNDTQIRMLAKKLLLAKREFEMFVECSLSSESMIDLWRARRPNF